MVRVLIVEDDLAIQQALSRFLAERGRIVVAAVSKGGEASAWAQQAEVAIVDMSLPDVAGPAVLRALKRENPALRAIVLSAHGDAATLNDAIAAGADGYLLKGCRLEALSEAIDAALEGHAPVSAELSAHLFEKVRLDSGEGRPPTASPLTEREHEVLRLLVGGHSYAAIAGALHIRPGTVQNHVKNIYRKLDVASKAEAVAVALREGLVG